MPRVATGLPTPMHKTLLAAIVFLALFAVACSGDPADQAGTSASPVEHSPASASAAPSASNEAEVADLSAAPIATDLPAIDTIDVRTGDTVNLQSLVPSEKPLLLWFWAPH